MSSFPTFGQNPNWFLCKRNELWGLLHQSNWRNQFDCCRKKREIGELLRLGSNLAGGVGVSGGGSSGFDGNSGGEGRVGSGVV